MNKARRTILAIAFTCVAIAPLALAQPAGHPRTQAVKSPMDGVMSALFGAKTFEQAAIAPDGKQLAWVETTKAGSAIFVSTVTGGTPRRITAGGMTESAVAWSPDSKQIAFFSDAAKSGQPQIYVTSAAGGASRKLTSVKGFLSTPGWSPDGKTIAFLFTENAERAAGPLVAEKAQTGVIKEAVTEQRLTLVNVASGKTSQISPADMYVYEYDWSPDSKSFVTTARARQRRQ
ncbi:MAG TPA: hypothetical protein VHA06_19725 [Candidatus Angelobacter sp.]|jgi:dipeptidyl aminopeptidase/acylaminoacyl peptidase|nr:hypothetical protein [Candidatus Angelobacter sp.]